MSILQRTGRNNPEQDVEIIQRESLDPFSSLRHSMNRLFDDFYRSLELSPGLAGNWGLGAAGFNPRAEIAETDDAITVTAELPGMTEDEVEVEVTDHRLSLKGEKRRTMETKKEGYFRSERDYGYFQRTFGLPEGADTDHVDAKFNNGVLTVIVPKNGEGRRKVPIRGGE